MPIIEIAAVVVCSTGFGYLIGKYPPLPDFMTREADQPIRRRVRARRARLARIGHNAPAPS